MIDIICKLLYSFQEAGSRSFLIDFLKLCQVARYNCEELPDRRFFLYRFSSHRRQTGRVLFPNSLDKATDILLYRSPFDVVSPGDFRIQTFCHMTVQIFGMLHRQNNCAESLRKGACVCFCSQLAKRLIGDYWQRNLIRIYIISLLSRYGLYFLLHSSYLASLSKCNL